MQGLGAMEACAAGAVGATPTIPRVGVTQPSTRNALQQARGKHTATPTAAHSSAWPGGRAAVVMRFRSLLNATCVWAMRVGLV